MLEEMRWLACVVLVGCARPYSTSALPPAGIRFACVDVWVEATTRHEAEGPVVVVHLGNRCDHSTRVDLGSLHVVGLDDSGATWPLDVDVGSVEAPGPARWIRVAVPR